MTIRIDVETPRCPKCGSTNRGKYHRTRELCNVRIGSKFYARIVMRYTKCLDCGQHRIERSLEPEVSALRNEGEQPADVNAASRGNKGRTGVDSAECTRPPNSKRKSKQSTRNLRKRSKPQPSTEPAPPST